MSPVSGQLNEMTSQVAQQRIQGPRKATGLMEQHLHNWAGGDAEVGSLWFPKDHKDINTGHESRSTI